MRFSKHFVFIVLILLFSTLYISCSPMVKYAKRTENSYEIRVKLKTAVFPLQIKGHKLVITDSINGQTIIKYSKKMVLTVKQSSTSLMINDKEINAPISIVSQTNAPIYVNNRCYFGSIRIYPGLNPLVLNYIPIETYLLSVVPSEVPSSFETEALKAQTVIARTYSYYFMLSRQNESFDVDDTTAYQVYNGFSSLIYDHKASHRIFRAVAATNGVIITYGNKPIVAYFHSNSGGRTKSGLSYFGPKSDFPYLTAHDDPYSVDQPAYSWTFSMTRSEFNKLFGQNATISQEEYCQNIKSENKTFDTKTIRRMIGYTKVKSETFKLNIDENNVTFTGFGYGHGVGMSQWGANKMAKEKFSYQDIILFYYPGTKLDRF